MLQTEERHQVYKFEALQARFGDGFSGVRNGDNGGRATVHFNELAQQDRPAAVEILKPLTEGVDYEFVVEGRLLTVEND